MKLKWKPVVEQLKNLSEKWKKPVIITELGYCSGPGTFKCPRNDIPKPESQEL